VELITPLLGGGVEPRKCDPITVIRTSAIRGHLRMWWRSFQSPQIGVDGLKRREDEVWGCTTNPSPVVISCESNSAGRVLRTNEIQELGIAGHNRLFPIQVGDQTQVRAEVKFTLQLRYPHELEQDVRMALRYWLNFGGLGSRSRRGAGAVFSEAYAFEKRDRIPPAFPNFQNPQAWPQIGQRVLIHPAAETAGLAWRRSIDTYRQFRQGLDENTSTAELGSIQPRRISPMILRPIRFQNGATHAGMFLLNVASGPGDSLRRGVWDHFQLQASGFQAVRLV